MSQVDAVAAQALLADIGDGGICEERVEYTLTPQGESFVPILLAMKQWGEKELGL